MRVRRQALGPLLLALGLLMAGPAPAARLKLTTWNMEWLTTRPAGDPGLPSDAAPREASDFTRLRAYAEDLHADVIAFQEVDGPAMAARVFSPDRYDLHVTGDHVVQRVGLAVRHGLAFSENPDMTALAAPTPGAAATLRSGADITLQLGDGRSLRILAVHLKTGCADQPLSSPLLACATLARQLDILQGWIAARTAEGGAFAVIGDFNRVMDHNDAAMARLRAAGPLLRATEGYATPCWDGGRFIDHILLGGTAMHWLVPGSLRVLVYRETDDADREHLSDHCPVSATLDDTRR